MKDKGAIKEEATCKRCGQTFVVFAAEMRHYDRKYARSIHCYSYDANWQYEGMDCPAIKR